MGGGQIKYSLLCSFSHSRFFAVTCERMAYCREVAVVAWKRNHFLTKRFTNGNVFHLSFYISDASDSLDEMRIDGLRHELPYLIFEAFQFFFPVASLSFTAAKLFDQAI